MSDQPRPTPAPNECDLESCIQPAACIAQGSCCHAAPSRPAVAALGTTTTTAPGPHDGSYWHVAPAPSAARVCGPDADGEHIIPPGGVCCQCGYYACEPIAAVAAQDVPALADEARRHAEAMREVMRAYKPDQMVPSNRLWLDNTARLLERLADALAPQDVPEGETPPSLVALHAKWLESRRALEIARSVDDGMSLEVRIGYALVEVDTNKLAAWTPATSSPTPAGEPPEIQVGDEITTNVTDDATVYDAEKAAWWNQPENSTRILQVKRVFWQRSGAAQ